MNVAQFIHSAVDGHSNHFPFLQECEEAITNNAAVNILVQIFLWAYALILLGNISGRGISGF